MRRARPLSMEDLRPTTLEGIAGQEAALERLGRLVAAVRAGRIVPPNLLLHGPPGVGKTTAARAFGRALLGDDWENSFHRLDASDDRGLARMLGQVLPLAIQRPSRRAPFRVFFFDEADALSPEVQSAMRPAMEAGTTLFLLACNDLGAITPPIRSRCTLLEFSPVGSAALRKVVLDALARAGIATDEERVRSIVARSAGIPRDAVKIVVEEVLSTSASS